MKQSKILIGVLALVGIMTSCEKDEVEQKKEQPISKEIKSEVLDINAEESEPEASGTSLDKQEVNEVTYTDEEGNPVSARVNTNNRRIVGMLYQGQWFTGKVHAISLYGNETQRWFKNPFQGTGSIAVAPNCKLEFRGLRRNLRGSVIDRTNQGTYRSQSAPLFNKGRQMKISCRDRKARFAGVLSWNWRRGSRAQTPIWNQGNTWFFVNNGGKNFHFNPASRSIWKRIRFKNNAPSGQDRSVIVNIGRNSGGNQQISDQFRGFTTERTLKNPVRYFLN